MPDVPKSHLFRQYGRCGICIRHFTGLLTSERCKAGCLCRWKYSKYAPIFSWMGHASLHGFPFEKAHPIVYLQNMRSPINACPAPTSTTDHLWGSWARVVASRIPEPHDAVSTEVKRPGFDCSFIVSTLLLWYSRLTKFRLPQGAASEAAAHPVNEALCHLILTPTE